jgi:hypothetical protein
VSRSVNLGGGAAFLHYGGNLDERFLSLRIRRAECRACTIHYRMESLIRLLVLHLVVFCHEIASLVERPRLQQTQNTTRRRIASDRLVDDSLFAVRCGQDRIDKTD